MNDTMVRQLIIAQKNEITEYHVYRKLAKAVKDEHNSGVLKKIAGEELSHYNFWRKHTGKEVGPNRFQVFKFFLIARVFGVTFGIKLMERAEEQAQIDYGRIAQSIPEANQIISDENRHEKELVELIEE